MRTRPNFTLGMAAALLATVGFSGVAAMAQTDESSTAETSSVSEAWLALPDAPGATASNSSSSASSLTTDARGAFAPAAMSGAALPEASKTTKYIEPGQTAPALSAGNKVVLGVKDAFSPFAAVGWLASAGYSHVTNGSPNYGTDKGAFGQRLGAAVIRDASEGIFTDSVLAPILHEDPRYYRLGPSRNFFVRLVYAGTRPIITKTDGGHTTLNLASIGGNLAGSGLTNAYYPQLNRGWNQTMQTFGGSVGGSALGDVVSEFFEDLTGIFHSKK